LGPVTSISFLFLLSTIILANLGSCEDILNRL